MNFFFRAVPVAYGDYQASIYLEIELSAYTTATATPDLSRVSDLHHSSWQHRILNPLREAMDQTHYLMVPSWICFHCATMGIPITTSKAYKNASEKK